MTWLGSTMGCCECHDHKYDPFTSKDFYSMEAFFADIRQWGVYQDYNYTPNPDLKGWSNDHPFPPEIEVESDYQKKRMLVLFKELLGRSTAAVEAFRSAEGQGNRLDGWEKEIAAFERLHPDGWATPIPAVDREVAVDGDGWVTFPAKVTRGEPQTITLAPGAGWVVSIRIEMMPTPVFGNKISRTGVAAVIVTPSVVLKRKDGKEEKLAFFWGVADRVEVTRYANTEPILGLLNGWRTVAADADQPHTAMWSFDRPRELADGDRLVVILGGDAVGRARVGVSPLPIDDPKALTEELEPLGFVPPVPAALTHARFLLGTAADKDEFDRLKAVRKEMFLLNHGKAWTQVTVPATPITTRILPRGNWMDETAPIVQPAVPSFLPGIENKENRRLTRLDLANWITAKDNPLTARVFVNRLWKQFFGTGLSPVMEDVGAQGEAPSHPELLDRMAAEFAKDWDVKKAVRRIVLSSAYRQDSKARPELKDLDPNNRLVAFMSPRRLEAEFVRDSALAAAGLLDLDLGGPSAFPYQPAGYYANLQFPDRNYVANADDRQYRRGLYIHWQRTFLHPMLANFDAPSREECTASRPTANTPQQALTLLNDTTFTEAARVLASNVLTDNDIKTDEGRLDRVWKLVLARGTKPAERDMLLKFLADRRAYYRAHPDEATKRVHVGNALVPKSLDPVAHAAWAEVCRVVLNLQEAITRY
jgi:hypothetical protein